MNVLRDAFHRGFDAALWVIRWSFRNVFFIERDGGPFTYMISLVVLITFPGWMFIAFIAEFLLEIDDHLSAEGRPK